MHYVDSDVFLYWATDHAQHGKRATEIIRHIELNEKAVTSTFSIFLFDKVMQTIEGYGLRKFLEQVGKIRNLRVVPMEVDHLRDAAEASTKFKIPMDAAVGYAVAKERGIAAVYSTNPAYDKTDLRRDF